MFRASYFGHSRQILGQRTVLIGQTLAQHLADDLMATEFLVYNWAESLLTGCPLTPISFDDIQLGI